MFDASIRNDGDDGNDEPAPVVSGSRGELSNDNSGLGAPAIVGVSIAGLLLLLAILFLGSRRKNKSNYRYKYDDLEEEMLVSPGDPYESTRAKESPRQVHVVGEENSVMTSWSTSPSRFSERPDPIPFDEHGLDGVEEHGLTSTYAETDGMEMSLNGSILVDDTEIL